MNPISMLKLIFETMKKDDDLEVDSTPEEQVSVKDIKTVEKAVVAKSSSVGLLKSIFGIMDESDQLVTRINEAENEVIKQNKAAASSGSNIVQDLVDIADTKEIERIQEVQLNTKSALLQIREDGFRRGDMSSINWALEVKSEDTHGNILEDKMNKNAVEKKESHAELLKSKRDKQEPSR